MNIPATQSAGFVSNTVTFARTQIYNVGRLSQSLIGLINTTAQRYLGHQLGMVATGIIVTGVVLASCYLLWKCICVIRNSSCNGQQKPLNNPQNDPFLKDLDPSVIQKAEEGDRLACKKVTIEIKKKIGAAHFLTAKFYEKAKKYDKAMEALEISAHYENIDGIVYLAQCKAEGLLNCQKDPKEAADGYFLAAKISFSEGKLIEAKKYGIKVLEQISDISVNAMMLLFLKLKFTDSDLQKIVVDKNERTQLYSDAATYFFNLSTYVTTERQIQELGFELEPSHSKIADEWLKIAVEGGGIKAMEYCVTNGLGDKLALSLKIATHYESSNDFITAINYYQKAVEMGDQNASGIIQKLIPKALEAYQKNPNLDEVPEYILDTLANFCEKYGQKDELQKLLLAAAKQHENSGNFITALKYYKKTVDKGYENAIEILTKLIPTAMHEYQNNPENIDENELESLSNICEKYGQKEELQKFFLDVSKHYENSNNFITALKYYQRALDQGYKNEHSNETLTKLIQLEIDEYRKNPEEIANYNLESLGDICEKNGKKNEAQEFYLAAAKKSSLQPNMQDYMRSSVLSKCLKALKLGSQEAKIWLEQLLKEKLYSDYLETSWMKSDVYNALQNFESFK